MVARKPHKYEIGDVINDSLIVVNKLRKGKNNVRAYEVQSMTYPDAPTYEITEGSANRGRGDAYVARKKIYEGNSLYSIEWVRPYLVDVKQAKTIAPKTSKKITFKCPECNTEKIMSPHKFMNRGLCCPFCSKGTSYPELFMLAYFKVKGIDYEYQKRFEFLPNRTYDFYLPSTKTVIEVHGEQHYRVSKTSKFNLYKDIDEEKAKHLEENGINLIVLNCSKSDFGFIRHTIKENNYLEDIQESEEYLILEYLMENRVYPTQEIIKKYKEGKSTIQLGEEYNLDKTTINGILRKSNINIRNSRTKRVKCLNTGRVFDSLKEASEWCGLVDGRGITRTIKGTQEYAGTHPSTGEKLKWKLIF